MGRILQGLKSAFIDSEAFERNKKAAMARNITVLKVSLIMIVVILFLLLASTFVFEDIEYMRAPYIIILCVTAGLLVLCRYADEHTGLLYIYITQGILISYSTITSAFISPSFICVTILALLFLLPVAYIDKNWRINLAMVISAACYLLVVCQYKDTVLITDEIVNVTAFTVMGCMMGAFIRRSLLESFESQEKLRVSEEQYRLVMQRSGNIICRFDVTDRSMSISPEIAQALDIPAKIFDVPNEPILRGMISPESVDAYIEMHEDIVRGSKQGEASLRVMIRGGWRWVKASYATMFSETGSPVYAVITYADVTEQREQEMAYEKWKQEFASLPKQDTALFEWNLTRDVSEGETGDLVEYFKDLPVDSFNNRTAAYTEKYVWPEDARRYSAFINREVLLEEYRQGASTLEIEYREKHGDGYRWMLAKAQLVPYPDSRGVKVYLFIKDIDKEKRLALDTQTRAREDALTGVLNRDYFERETTELLLAAKPGDKHAFVMMDVDGFKNVNDTLGHMTGDNCLVETADCLRSMLRSGDIIGRLGGDEFVAVMKYVSDTEIVEKRAAGLCAVMRRELAEDVRVSASIGIAMFPEDGADFDELYRRADIALYEAKRRGRDKYCFYSPEIDSRVYATNVSTIDEQTQLPED